MAGRKKWAEKNGPAGPFFYDSCVQFTTKKIVPVLPNV